MITITGLRALHAELASGFWVRTPEFGVIAINQKTREFLQVEPSFKNEAFLIAAHNELPAVWEELENLRADNARLRQEIRDLKDKYEPPDSAREMYDSIPDSQY